MKAAEVTAAYGDVPHMTPYQGERLWTLLREGRVERVLELGALYGRSACYMAAAMHERGRGKVLSLGRPTAPDEPDPETFRQRLGLADHLEFRLNHEGYHWDMLQLLRDGAPPFDFIYLDGGHYIGSESGAWALAERLLRPGGVMLFDDLNWSPESSSWWRENKPDQLAAWSEDYRTARQVELLFEHLVAPHPHVAWALRNRHVGLIWKAGPDPAFTVEALQALYPPGFWWAVPAGDDG